MSLPWLAITSQAFSRGVDIVAFCEKHDCNDVEYTFPRDALDPSDLAAASDDLRTLCGAGLTVRYHLAFSGRELADGDSRKAREALAFQKYCLELAADNAGRFATVHLCLGKPSEHGFEYAAAVDNLGSLVRRGRELGIRVCLENLRKGWTNSPQGHRDLLDATDAWATLDVGHARAVQQARGDDSALDYVNLCGQRILEAHVYEIERVPPDGGKAYHVAPTDMEGIAPVLDRLITDSSCACWMIELPRLDETTHTLQLLRSHLQTLRTVEKPPPRQRGT